ncbi:ABC3 transporter permease protein domain-containing protein OS=Cellulomonas persica OX=76861 GN=CPE01_17770 PE=4 SV=1 [Cellulomonas persica]|uniref:ABC3 transporter permease C-terminal domain-containing protein n=2 Tax=Cellulomonas persica TaxID=76861 RepID=A0A510UTM8_9CELL|nr:hypothetical protein CPE01_17770 [Cellulomonas persica]
MTWMPRLLAHRTRAHSTLLLAVVAVTVVAATLLGTFALLLSVGGDRAPQVALDRAGAQATTIDVRSTVGNNDHEKVAAAMEAGLAELLGPVDAEVRTWTSSPWLLVDRGPGLPKPLVYLADYPIVPELTALESGQWPTTAWDGEGVPVAVPVAAAEEYGWELGDVLRTEGTDVASEIPVRVVATYRAEPPRGQWSRDLLEGRVHLSDYPVPGSFGGSVAEAWGPLVVAPGTGAVIPGTLRLEAWPDLDSATPAELDGLRERLSTAQTDLYAAVPAATTDVLTSLDRTLDSIAASLAVTRVGVVVVGLMLLVVAVTVLLLAARLLAERRAAEQTLLTSRGASHPQLVGLAALEALGVAALATLAAPWLAGLVYRGVTRVPVLHDAGLAVDPGAPALLWLTCAVASLLLAGVLLAPSLRRRVSAVDSEQQEVRQDRKQALARSGVDLAVVVVAGVALWQLLRHGSPVLDGSGGFDPLLVAAPALVLLAGGVLAGRVLPLVAGVGEVVARRSRALVAPLTAWEISRRPRRAAGAVLLVTLAVAVGTFAQGWHDTWRTSQREQAELEVGTDLRVTDLDGSVLDQSARVAAVDGLSVVSPVGMRQVQAGVATGPAPSVSGITTTMLAVDTRHAGDLLRGRLDGGWSAATAGLAPASPVTGVPVPAGTSELGLTLTARVTADLGPGVSALTSASLVVQDARGARVSLDLPPVPTPLGDAPDEPTELTVPLPEGLGAVQVIGVSLRLTIPGDLWGMLDAQVWDLPWEAALGDVRALDADGEPTPLDLGRGQWRTSGGVPLYDPWIRLGSTWVDDDGLHVTGTPNLGIVADNQAALFTTSFDREPIVHALVTPDLLAQLSATEDDVLAIDVDGTVVQLRIDGQVPYLPGLPRGAALLVDRDSLLRATLVTGSRATLTDEWWALVDDDDARDAAAAVQAAGVGRTTTRVEAAAQATDGPLHVAIPAALWIVTLSAVALAVAGIALSATVAVRTRRLELARLQALGASQGSLARSIVGEYLLLGVIGTAAGIGVGALLAWVVGPLVTVSPRGLAPVPAVVVQWPWPVLGSVVGALALGAMLAVVVTTRALLRRASGALLRLGDEG